MASSGTLNDVGVGQIDAEQVARLRLDDGPGGHAADLDVVGGAEHAVGAQVAIGDQLAGGDRVAGGVQLVRAQEHLVRGMRGVGLVLVDERSGRVVVLVDVVGGAEDAVRAGLVGGPRQHHEVGRAARRRTADHPACSGMKTVPLPPLVTRSRP